MKNVTVVFYAPSENSTQVFRLPGNYLVPNAQCYSYSTLLSLAGFMVWKFPYLTPPGINKPTEPKFRQETFPDRLALTHQMFSYWVEYFMDELMQGNGLRKNDTLYMKIRISQEYSRTLFLHEFDTQEINHKMSWKDVQTTLNQESLRLNQKNKNVLLITCSITKIKKITYHAPAKIAGIFFNNQNWKAFWIMMGEFPSKQEFANATQIIVPGSTLSFIDSNNIEPKVVNLMRELKTTFETNKKVKFLGLCYGHQLIAELFNPGSVQTTCGTYPGLSKVQKHANQLLGEFKFLDCFSKTQLTKLHYEEVVEVPDTFLKVVQSSSGCVDMMVSKDGRHLCIQGHPEYSFLRYNSLLALDRMHKENITSNQMIKMIESRHNPEDGCLIFQQICREYLEIQ